MRPSKKRCIGSCVAVAVIVAVCFVTFRTVTPGRPFGDSKISAAPREFAKYQDRVPGYVPFRHIPNSTELLPPPPAASSTALADDLEMSQKLLAEHDSQRWTLAAADADLKFPAAIASFEKILEVPLTPTTAPHLYRLLQKTLTDFGLATKAAKDAYKRPRPFMVNAKPTCAPADDAALVTSGSYPSGHSAVGYGWALLLSEIAPEHSAALLDRGRDFGQSRVVCNVNWSSDIRAGQDIARIVVDVLSKTKDFTEDLTKAKLEYEALRSARIGK